MRINSLILFLSLLFLVEMSYSQDALPNPINENGGDNTYWGTTGIQTISSVSMTNNAKVTIEGDLNVTKIPGASSVNIAEGCVLIVNGDMVIGSLNSNAKLVLDGTLIVTGNLIIGARNEAVADVENNGILVVGENYISEGIRQGEEETNEGNVFLSNPTDGSGFTDSDGNPATPGDIGDLINSGLLPDDLIDDFVDEYEKSLETTTWTGVNDNWANSNNWDNNIPTEKTNVIITPNGSNPFSCSDDEYNIWNLTLNNSSELTIPSGKVVTIYGDVTIPVDAKLTIKNSNGSPTSLIIHGEVSGQITFEWTFDNQRYWFVGHPISNPSLAVYEAIDNAADNRCVLFDYTSDGKLVNTLTTSGYFAANDELRGYQLKVLKDKTVVSQTGTMNSAPSYSKTVHPNEGWQIIANPYPAYYKLPVDNGDFAATAGSVYVTEATSNADKQFHTFNVNSGITSPSNSITDGIIAPGQAFYIKTAAGAAPDAVITMSANNLVHSPGTQLKSAIKKDETNILRLQLSNEYGLTDEAVIALFEDGELVLNQQDSEQRIYSGTNISYIYSLVEDTKTVINVLPESVFGYSQLIGVKTKAGKQTLKINGLDNLTEHYAISLIDNVAGVTTEMTNSTIYEFIAEEGEEHKRFELQFNQPNNDVATDIENQTEEKGIKIYTENASTINISTDWEVAEKIVSVYTLDGSQVMTDVFNGTNYIRNLDMGSGIYLVKVTGGTYQYQQKVFIK